MANALEEKIKQCLANSNTVSFYSENDVDYIRHLCTDSELDLDEAVARWEVLEKERIEKDMIKNPMRITISDCIYED